MPVPPIAASLTSEFLVVGEGTGDADFIKHLCTARNISHFQVEDVRGESKFVTILQGLKSRTGSTLKGLLVVGDNDDSPDDNFEKIRGYLKAAKLPYAEAPLVPATRDGLTAVVMMLPYENRVAKRGCLDTLLLQCVMPEATAFTRCISDYRQCINGNPRAKSHEDKFILRCLIAAMWKDDPNLSLGWALSPSKGIFDMNHASLNEIARFLQDFPSLCR